LSAPRCRTAGCARRDRRAARAEAWCLCDPRPACRPALAPGSGSRSMTPTCDVLQRCAAPATSAVTCSKPVAVVVPGSPYCFRCTPPTGGPVLRSCRAVLTLCGRPRPGRPPRCSPAATVAADFTFTPGFRGCGGGVRPADHVVEIELDIGGTAQVPLEPRCAPDWPTWTRPDCALVDRRILKVPCISPGTSSLRLRCSYLETQIHVHLWTAGGRVRRVAVSSTLSTSCSRGCPDAASSL